MDPDEEPFGGALNIGSETTEAEKEFVKVNNTSFRLWLQSWYLVKVFFSYVDGIPIDTIPI